MKHARDDYQRIQDPDGKIGDDEPVFLLRAKDRFAPDVVRRWAQLVYDRGRGNEEMSRLASEQADRMEAWQREHGAKTPDLPAQTQNEPEMGLR